MFARQHLGRVPIVGSAVADLVLAAMSLHAGASMWDLDIREDVGRFSPRPIFFIHGQDDFVVLPENLAVLYDLANEPKQKWLSPGQHSNIMTAHFDEYQSRVLTFFGKVKG